MKEVKIVSFWLHLSRHEDHGWDNNHRDTAISNAERQIEQLLNKGWHIVTGGGGGDTATGFVVLVRNN